MFRNRARGVTGKIFLLLARRSLSKGYAVAIVPDPQSGSDIQAPMHIAPRAHDTARQIKKHSLFLRMEDSDDMGIG